MSDQIQVLKEQEVFGKMFRIYGDIDNPLFLAKDIAELIEYAQNPDGSYQISKMLNTVDDTEKLQVTILLAGQNRTASVITEDGLYEVLMQSRKPIAKEFKKQVKAILKQIRQTGGYIPVKEDDDESSIMAKALIIANKTLEKKDKIIQELQPKAEGYDKFLNGSNYQAMNEVAKVVGYGRNKLFEFLRDNGILRWNNTPYQTYIDRGYFVVKESVIDRGYNIINQAQTYVLPKGIEFISKLLKEKGVQIRHA